MLRIALLCILIAGSAIAPFNSVEGQKRPISSPDSALEPPLDEGFLSPAIYADAGARPRFHLDTSWISGKDHKGMFRYKVSVTPTDSAVDHVDKPDFFTPTAIAAQMKRIHACSTTLILYDKDGFILRQVDMLLGLGVNAQGNVIALYANSAEQMDASEYRQFVSGGWSVTWNCPDQ